MGVFARTKKGRTIYFFRTEINGTQYERVVGSRKDEALAAMIRFRDDMKRGGIQLADPRQVPTLKKFKAEFLEACRERQTKPTTLAGYERRLDKMSETNLGNIPLGSITRADWQKFVEARQAEKREGQDGVAAINRDRDLLRNVLNTAFERGRLDKLPAIKLRKLKGEKRRDYAPPLDVVRKYLAAAETTSLFGVEAPDLRDVGLISATTGARLGEVVRLSRKNITEAKDGLLWRVQDGKSEASSWPMLIPKGSKAYDAVRARLQRSEKAFPGDAPEETVRKISKAHRKLADRLGLDRAFVVHSWRHLAITVRAFFEENPVKLRKFARHEDIRTTMIYTETERLSEAPKVKALLRA